MPELSRLDGTMNRRRLDLGLTWRQLAERANVSYETLRAVRKGEASGGELTKRNIERALRWQVGSFEAIEAGGDPVELPQGDPETSPAAETSESESDPRAAAILTIIEGLPTRVQLDVLRQLGDRIPPEARPPANDRKRQAG